MTRLIATGRLATRIAWLAVLALMLAGCRIHIVQETVVNEDGSGTLRAVLALDEEAREALASLDADADELFDLGSQAEGWDVQDWSEDDLTGIELTRTFADLAEVAAILEEPDQTIPVDRVSLTQNGDEFIFEATLGDSAALDEAAADTFFDVDQVSQLLSEFVETEIRLDLPGDVLSHNADREEGMLIWDIDIAAPSRTLTATSTVGGGISMGAIAAGAGVVVLAAGAALLLLRRPKQPDTVTAPAPTEPGLAEPAPAETTAATDRLPDQSAPFEPPPSGDPG